MGLTATANFRDLIETLHRPFSGRNLRRKMDGGPNVLISECRCASNSLEHGFDAPALAVHVGDELGTDHRFRQIRQDEERDFPVARGLFQADLDPTGSVGVALLRKVFFEMWITVWCNRAVKHRNTNRILAR